jgi:hypothetical protein
MGTVGGGGAVSPGLKRPGREADRSPPYSDEIKNVGARPPLPNMSSWRVPYLIKHREFYLLPCPILGAGIAQSV